MSSLINKLTLRDKIILLSATVAIIAYVCYSYLYVSAKSTIDSVNQQIDALTPKDFTYINEKLGIVESENASQIDRIQQIKEIENGNGFDTQDFLIFLSAECEKNQAKLIKFNDLGQIAPTDGVKSSVLPNSNSSTWKLQYDFEIRGDISAINKVCESIDKLGVKYSVGGMSLRQDKGYPYLERFFDGVSNLEWYKDPIPTDEQEEAKTAGSDDLTTDFFPDYWYFPEVQSSSPTPTPAPQPTQTPAPTPTPEPDTALESDTTTETQSETATTEDVTGIESQEEVISETGDGVADDVSEISEAESSDNSETVYTDENADTLNNDGNSEPPYVSDDTELSNLDEFLELSSHYRPMPKIMLVSSPEDSNLLRLNVTIQFILYSDPKTSHMRFGQEG